MVGGSWRALARIDMIATDYPLPVKHQYAMPPERAKELRQMVGSLDAKFRKSIAPARLATSPVAAMILAQLAGELQPSELILSSFGIREGLLYETLSKAERKRDPLIAAARDAGGAERRFGEHGDILDGWIGSAFDDLPAMSRIRHASCLLTDVAWQATPDFRADRGVEMALHGNWVGVDAAGPGDDGPGAVVQLWPRQAAQRLAGGAVHLRRDRPGAMLGPRHPPRPEALRRRRIGASEHPPEQG